MSAAACPYQPAEAAADDKKISRLLAFPNHPTAQPEEEVIAKPKQPNRAVTANAGITAAYQKRLRKLIRDMDASVQFWVEQSYRKNTPIIAMDARRRVSIDLFENPDVIPPDGSTKFLASDGKTKSWDDMVAAAMDEALPASALQKAIRKLAKRWLTQFDEAAPKLAEYFAQAVEDRTSKQLEKILRDGGLSVRFKMTKAMRDVVQATTAQNVSLIKSIPQQYFKDVEGAVMRSVQQGRDLGTLTKDLVDNYGVTQRRAAFIALSQNNMATAAMAKARQDEAGITHAKWRHSAAGRHPRPTHVANNNKLYNVKEGWFDPAVKKHIWPGELPNCRCQSIPVIPGFE